MTGFPTVRARRLRRTPAIRRMVTETRLDPSRLVLPAFVVNGEGIERPIATMPGHAQRSVDRVVDLAREAATAGIAGMILFGIPDEKDPEGTAAWDPDGPVPRALRAIKKAVPDLVLWADVCLCEYTIHGHCGPLRGTEVDNDAALPSLARAAVTYADAGADVVAPSDMMDGRVAAIRSGLDAAGHENVAVCSYAVKYASAYYGPFRDAAESAPAFGDRRSYQMDPANAREARREALLDVDEGADMIMVKPAGPYQDVIRDLRDRIDLPLVAYQVSGEMAMVEAAAAAGWIDRDRIIIESLTGIVRSGADIVITYFALDAARLIREQL